MARHFNGSSDQITFGSISSALSTMRFGSVVAVVQRGGTAGWNGPVALSDGGGNAIFLDIAPASHVTNNALWANYGTNTNGTIKVLDTDGWVIVAATKATGSQAIHLHKYVFSTNTWTHTTNATSGDILGAPNAVTIGNADGDFFLGDIDVVAYFATALTDTQVETLASSLSAWDALSPAGMWVLNQASTATAVTDRTGNGTNQTAISGTSIATTSSPLTGGPPTTAYTAVAGAPVGVTALPGSLTKALNAAGASGALVGFTGVIGTLTIGLNLSGPKPSVIGLSAIPGVLTTSSPSNLALVAPALAEVGFAGQAAALEFDLLTTVSLAGFNASPGVLSVTSANLNGNLGASILGASAVPGVLHFDVTGNTQYVGIPATFGESALGGVVGLDIAGKPAGIFGYSGRAGRLRIGLGRDIDFTYGFADEDQWSFGRADA